MKKVLSFSIYGDNPKYLIGLSKNIKLAQEIYKGWGIYIYYNNTVPTKFVNLYSNNRNVSLFDMSDNKFPGMFWRFLPNDVDLFIVRDADSRLNIREQRAVEDWISSNKILHIMRDHPHHNFPVLGGMWGIRLDEIRKQNPDFNITEMVGGYLKRMGVEKKELSVRMVDMDFLKDVIYKLYEHNSYVNDSVFNINEHSLPFPTKMEDFGFVGEIFEADDVRNYQFNEWKNRKEKGW
jgi:protein O-GlcNAc transferase